jgi:allantoinase
MPDFDLFLRNGRVVLEDRVERADLAVVDGRIAAIDANIIGTGREEIDCSALHIFPGVIDAHVHFNEPGRTDWEGLATGSRAVAAGGGTCFFDMPLNSTPPVLDGAAFDAKRAAAEAQSVTDFAIWGGLTPLNLDRIDELHARGVVGLKAFMCNSGIDDFPRADEATLRAGMKHAARLNLLVAVHAESETMTQRPLQSGGTIREYLDSRSIAAEVDAIRVACELAGETGCRLHVVHVSSTAGVALIGAQQHAGVDVTCETCPHYLVLSEDDVLALGAVAKCSPPIRSLHERDLLVREVLTGRVQTIGSDHSPSPPEMKQSDNFFAVWGGIGGAQHLLPLLLDLWLQQAEPDWPLLSRLLSINVAKRFRLPSPVGRAAVGADANLALIDLAGSDTAESTRLHYRHKLTPYAGRKLRGKVVRTLLRGQTIARDGQAVGNPAGRLIVPSTS